MACLVWKTNLNELKPANLILGDLTWVLLTGSTIQYEKLIHYPPAIFSLPIWYFVLVLCCAVCISIKSLSHECRHECHTMTKLGGLQVRLVLTQEEFKNPQLPKLYTWMRLDCNGSQWVHRPSWREIVCVCVNKVRKDGRKEGCF